MLKKSTCGAKACAFSAAAGTSTMIPTSQAGRAAPADELDRVVEHPAGRSSSSTVLTIGNMTLDRVSCATRTIARSWSASSCGWASDSRMPRTPRNGLASAGIGR